MSKAFGFASLRVGYAIAAPETAAVLERRRAPARSPRPPRGSPPRRSGSRGFDVDSTIAERERVRAALVAAGYDCPPTATNFVWVAHRPSRSLSGSSGRA